MRSSPSTFTAEVWEHDGSPPWHFISLPEALADEIEATFGSDAKGFGSIPVEVTIGRTRWTTSIFPDRERATYLLPVKKAVRLAEGLDAGSAVQVSVVVRASDRQGVAGPG